MKEWTALSVVKFFCVAVMIFVHAHIVLITNSYAITDTSGFFYGITSRLMFIGLFLFTLPIIAGAILRIDFGEHIIYEKLKNYKLGKIIKTAIFLSVAGFFMNAITWGWGYTFSWNVLQLVSLSFVVIAILMKISSIRAVFFAGLIAILAAQPLRDFLGNMDYGYFASIFIGADNSYIFWPFSPWFGVVTAGFLIAHFYLKCEDSFKFRIIMTILGATLVAIAFFRGELLPYLDPLYIWAPSLFQPKIGWVLASIGLFCILIIIGNMFFNKISLKKYGIINSYSQGILWIYIAQMFVSYNLAFYIKRIFPMDKPSLAYFILPIFMLLFSWMVGALSIKFLRGKSIVVTLKKIQ